MRSIILVLCALIAGTGSYAAEETPAAPANATAGTAADPDYIPPSTAIFSGIRFTVCRSATAGIIRPTFSQSVNKALNIAPKDDRSGGYNTGPKPLEVAPLSVPPSPDKTEGSSQGSAPQKRTFQRNYYLL